MGWLSAFLRIKYCGITIFMSSLFLYLLWTDQITKITSTSRLHIFSFFPTTYLTFTSIMMFLYTFPFNTWAPVDSAFRHHFTAISRNMGVATHAHSAPMSSRKAAVGLDTGMTMSNVSGYVFSKDISIFWHFFPFICFITACSLPGNEKGARIVMI